MAEIHWISDGKMEAARLIEIASAVHPLTDYIHLREKSMSARDLFALAEGLIRTGVPAGKLVINDRIDVALAAGAGGVQLAWHSLRPAAARAAAPGLRIGVSVHSPAEAAEAGLEGADYCLYGHVFPSACKPGQAARGLRQLREAVSSSSIPLIAVGGIRPDNAGEILQEGAAGIAVMSGIGSAADPAAAGRAYRWAADNGQRLRWHTGKGGE
ncbi:thiamine phosphate synthase [Paenibacillus sp. PK3_47]|uniref:thiamine phosphate synthase n=1 Tax=Paenibacillus sp. PK3_47 TaxID=2072642 RepID=UPI00201DAB8A|nr:thiamine phosphate synthase [Paenibacillus sp. PK3_47]